MSRIITHRSSPGVARRFCAQVTATGGSFSTFGLPCAELPTQIATPNHALQRTAPCVTVAAPRRPTAQLPRRTPLSLSLGSLGDCGTTLFTGTDSMTYPAGTLFRSDIASPASAEPLDSRAVALPFPVLPRLTGSLLLRPFSDATSTGSTAFTNSTQTPNHAMQLTGSAVTVAAIGFFELAASITLLGFFSPFASFTGSYRASSACS